MTRAFEDGMQKNSLYMNHDGTSKTDVRMNENLNTSDSCVKSLTLKRKRYLVHQI